VCEVGCQTHFSCGYHERCLFTVAVAVDSIGFVDKPELVLIFVIFDGFIFCCLFLVTVVLHPSMTYQSMKQSRSHNTVRGTAGGHRIRVQGMGGKKGNLY